MQSKSLIYKTALATYDVAKIAKHVGYDGADDAHKDGIEVMNEDADIKKVGGKKSAAERRKQLRMQLWPDVAEDRLWLRKSRQGFTTIPRALPLLGRIMDLCSGKGFPVQQTYLTLWCWVYDEGIVEIRNPRDFAFESGFSGTRGEATWRGRMKRLEELGFIASKPGVGGDFQFVLLINPFQVVEKLYMGKPKDVLYNALLSRMAQVGADDLDL